MKQTLYDEIYKAIVSRDCLLELAQKYTEVPYNTLLSIYAKKYQLHTRRTMWKHRKPEVRAEYYKRYLGEVSVGAADSVMLSLAEQHSIAPCLLARILLEHWVRERGADAGTDIGELLSESRTKALVSAYIQRPEIIEDPRMSWEVQQCIKFDDNYSPLVERVRQTIGLQYEYVLQERLHSLGIAFRGEDELRSLHFPKTPDVMLDVPLGVGPYVVRWVESKASFGDQYSHDINRQQCFSYVNRYGPGLIIYWFGFIDELDDCRDKGVIVMDDFPADIVLLQTGSDA